MSRIRTNFVAGLLDSGITDVATTFTSSASAGASGLPGLAAVTGSDVAVIVLDPDRVAGAPEIAYVTAHTAASGSATILRGQEGTTARAHATGAKWAHAITRADVELFGITPSTVSVVAASEGVSVAYARGDHGHAVSTAAASTIGANSSNTTGSATALARADHTHDIATATPNVIVPDASATEGTADGLARADHTHGIVCAAPSTNLDATSTNAEGVATSFTRSDHSHAISTFTGSPASVVTSGPNAGSVSSFAKGDHSHLLPPGIPRGIVSPTPVPVVTDVTGIGASLTQLATAGSIVLAANRWFEITGTWRSVLGTEVGNIFAVRIYVDGSTINEKLLRVSQTSNGEEGGEIHAWYNSGSGGFHTFSMQAIRAAGSGSLSIQGTFSWPIQLVVKDIGGT